MKNKFEPKGNKILHGAGQSLETFERYWNAVEKYKPAIYMTYIKLPKIKKWSDRIKKEISKFPNLRLQIGLNLRAEHRSQCKDITLGKWDKDFNLLYKTIKQIKNPVFLRIGYEFNNPHHGYKPKEFIQAWKYICDKLKENKVDNVATVWCACTAFNRDIRDIMPYYPGDEYVDWFGNDLFSPRHFKDNKDKVTEAFAREAKKHKKPLMIGESSAARVGVLEGKKSWNDWFKPYFRWLSEHNTKAFCYINWDWAIDWKQPEWGNCRIEENEIVRQKYIKELSKKKYIHNKE